MDVKPVRPVRFDWHRVTFCSCLGVAAVYLGLSTIRPDHKVPTIFEAEGQRNVKKHLLYFFPATAKTLGVTWESLRADDLAEFRARKPYQAQGITR